MNWKLAVSFGVAAAGAGATAFALDDTATQEVGGHRFAIPKERLFEDAIPWLPAPETDSFTFILDQAADPKQIPPHTVSVEPAERACRNERASQIVRVACGSERTRLQVGPPYTKVFPHPEYPFAWDYYVGKQPDQLQVAYCTPISPNPARPKATAICTTVWGVDNLVLSLGFEERELAELPSMRARATNMLRSWKLR